MKKKGLRITFNAPVTLTFGFLCVVVFLINLFTDGYSNQLLFITYHSSLYDPLTYVRFFTHVLGHSSWSHLIGNMSYILLLGPLLEEKYGSHVMIWVIALTGLVTGVFNYFLFPYSGLLGASGVVFALILLSSITSVKNGEIPLTFILVVIVFLGQQIYDGLFVADNISQFGHIVGGIVGSAVGFSISHQR